MKSLKRFALTGIALLMLAVPMTAQAQEWGYRHGYGCGLRHRDIAWDRHNLHSQWRDIGRDRFALHQDIANGNWAAARTERADIAQDYMNVRRQRWDLYHDYYGRNPGYVPPAAFNAPPRTNYLPPAAYAAPVNQPYAPGPYPVNYGANGQGLSALLGNFLP